MKVQYGQKSISSLMDKYDLEYAIVPKDTFDSVYMGEDERYTEIYKDKYFIIYKYEK